MPCRLYPLARIIRARASFPHRKPFIASIRAMARSDSTDQVISDIGSPRLPSSSRPSSACANPGCASAAAGRPAPGRRDRPGPSAFRASSSADSRIPAGTVTGDAPDTRATIPIPLRPAARASVPRYSRHWRSSSTRRITANFSASAASSASATVT